MGDWKEMHLDNLVKFQRGHDLTQSEMVKGQYPVAGSNGIIDYHNEYTTKGPGVTLGRSGNSIGVAHFYKANFWAHNTTLYSKEFVDSDPLFVFYFLKTIDFRTLNSGSAVPSLNRNHIHNITVKVPSLIEQKSIASILSSLDDKIDLLHRQNATLEAMAEAIFRQWFVEELSTNTMTTIGEFAANIRENVNARDLAKHSNYVGLEHIPKKSISLTNWGGTDNLESNKSLFKENDILFGKLRSYFHKVVFAPIDGVCSTDILVVRARKREWFSFCLFWLSNEDLVQHSDLGSGGTRMPRTNWEIISNYQIPKPNDQRVEDFDRIIRVKTEKIKLNLNQINTLKRLRDSLLPKLMSGEVRANSIKEK